MLTLFHAPNSRSSRIVTLIDEMGIADKVKLHHVDIVRMDGSGTRDSWNPHPEGKVPALIDDDALITESVAVILHLTTRFPDTGMAPPVGTPAWGEYVAWLAWYGSVMEPVIVFTGAKLQSPWLDSTFRGMPEVVARLTAALEKGPYLMGDSYSAADLLVHSPFAWAAEMMPDAPLIRDWVARCQARPSVARTGARDNAPAALHHVA